jgi:hypothetical protein
MSKRPTIAMSWFREEDWPTWLELDENFQPDREHWRRRCEGQTAALEARGIKVVKVTIDPPAFVAWADANTKDYGQMSRAAYAAIALHQRAPLWIDDGSAP